MPSSLQQVNFQFLDPPGDAAQPRDRVLTSLHRRRGVLVGYVLEQGIFEFHECKQWNDLRWTPLGAWDAKSVYEKVVSVLPVESYDVFAVFGINNNNNKSQSKSQSSSAVSFVGFDGALRSTLNLSSSDVITSVDFNQKTREFFVSFLSGVVSCLFLKVVSPSEYHLTNRRSSRFASGSAENAIVQIAVQDLINHAMLLTKKGHIISLTMDRFDVVFSLSPSLFALPPNKLIVDKFGTDFVVYCAQKGANKEQIEYWRPPADYASCRDHLFTRISLPVHSQVCSINFETIGLFRAKTLLAITTMNRKLQLLSSSENGSLICEAELRLNSPPSLWRETEKALHTNRWAQDPFFLSLAQNSSVQCFLPMPKLDDLSYKTLLLSSMGASTTFVGVHTEDEVETTMSAVLVDLEHRRIQVDSAFSQRQPSYVTNTQIQTLSLSPDDILDAMAPLEIGYARFNDSLPSEALRPSTLPMVGEDESTLSSHPQHSLHRESSAAIDMDSPRSSLGGVAKQQPEGEEENTAANAVAALTTDTAAVFETHTRAPTPRRPSSPPPGSLAMVEQQQLQSLRAPPAHLAANNSSSMMAVQRLSSSALLSQSSHFSDDNNDPETKFFFPAYYSQHKDLSKCSISNEIPSNVLNRIFFPNYLYIDESANIFSFNLKGLQMISPSAPMLQRDIVPVKFFSFAHRLGQVLVVSEVKDCLLYELNTLNKTPLRIPIGLRLQAKITVALCCDVLLRSPEPVHAVGKANKAKSKAIPDDENSFSLGLIGDDQGFVHFFVCDSAQRVLQSDVFRAHSTAVTHILTTGDCVRPLWVLGSEYTADVNAFVTPLSLPGSAIVSVSKEGEVKTWLPCSKESAAKGAPLDRFFAGNLLQWRLSGIFTTSSPFPTINHYATSYDVLETTASGKSTKKIVESVVLAPSCMNLLVAFTNGLIEEWHIPGIIDTQDTTLSTSQRPLWSTLLHIDVVVTMRVHVHSALASIREVQFAAEKDRDKILAGLNSFVRVSNRVKRTIGISFQETKVLCGASALVSCCLDRTLLLWGFQATFFQYCSFLHPVPCRKFYFSSAPQHGLAFCLNTQTNTPNSPHNVWRVDVVLDGRIVTIASDFRGKLFQGVDQFAIEDHRVVFGADRHFIPFDEEFSIAKTNHGSMHRTIEPIPVVAKVGKASALVNSFQQYNDLFHPKNRISSAFSPSNYPYLLSVELLESWAKVKEGAQSVLVREETSDEAIPRDIEWKEVVDIDAIPQPQRPPSPSKEVLENIVDIPSPVPAPAPAMIASQRPKSPATVNFCFPSQDDGEKNADEWLSSTRKVILKGLRLEIQAEKFEETLSFLDKVPDAKFVLGKFDHSSTPRACTPNSKEGEHISPMRNFEFPDGEQEKISFTDEITVSSTPMSRDAMRVGSEKHIESSNTSVDLRSSTSKKDDKEDIITVMTDESGETGPLVKVYQTKSTQLRQQLQQKNKERMDILENYKGPPGVGDIRKSTKSYYTSKNSILREDNKQFQGGTRQHMGTNTFFAPPLSGCSSKAGIVVATDKASAIAFEKPITSTKSLLDFGPDAEGVDSSAPLETEPGKFYYAREGKPEEPKSQSQRSARHSAASTAGEEVKQKYIVKKEAPPKPMPPLPVAVNMRRRNAVQLRKGRDEESQESFQTNSMFRDDDDDDDDEGSDDNSTMSLQSDLRSLDGQLDTSSQQKEKRKRARNPQFVKEKLISGDSSVNSRDALSARTGIAPVPVPQALFLDMPDQGLVRRRRNALQLTKNLFDRGINLENTQLENVAHVLTAAPDAGTKSLAEQSLDGLLEESLVNGYFDRNVKPIFVERKVRKQEVQRQRTRQSKVTEEVEEVPLTGSEKEAKEMEAMMAEMTDEDRLLFQELDPEARAKLMATMKATKSRDKTKLLRQLTQKALVDAKEKALLNMDLTLEPLDVCDVLFTVSVSSESGGSVYVVLLEAAHAGEVKSESFASERTLASIPGYREHRVITLAPKTFEEITFNNLHPKERYTVLSAVNLSAVNSSSIIPPDNKNKKGANNSKTKPPSAPEPVDTSKITTWWTSSVETQDELLDIEWARLDREMRLVEMRAAIRSELVQAKANFHFPPISLPSDEELQSSEFQALLTPNLDAKTRLAHKRKIKPILLTFYDWWVGDEKSRAATSIRSEFHSLECIQVVLNYKRVVLAFQKQGYSDADECYLLVDYVKKYTAMQKANQSMAMTSSPTSPTALLKSSPSVDLEQEGVSVKSRSSLTAATLLNEKGIVALKKFRSWYKGGQIIKDNRMGMLKEEPFCDEHSFASSESSLSLAEKGPSVHDLQHERLEQRTAFLKERIERVSEAAAMVARLFEGYKDAVAKGLRGSDLLYERANLQQRQIQSLMYAKKFLELCVDFSMITPQMEASLTTMTHNPRTNRQESPVYRSLELSALDAFNTLVQANPSLAGARDLSQPRPPCTPFVVVQRLSGADLFRDVDLEGLKPDEPPPVDIKCLPGTNRRPVRPWQLMSRADQDMEIALAASLDVIWELAVSDCVEVPAPEDRLLPAESFPLRRRVWEEFREWYSGEEGANPVPGEGVPTLARVLFSEQYETKQAEQDAYVLQLMLDRRLALPKQYRIEGASVATTTTTSTAVNDEKSLHSFDENTSTSMDVSANNFGASPAAPANPQTQTHGLSRKTNSGDDLETILQAYERAINTTKGAFLRPAMLAGSLNTLFRARRMNMLKYFWPPAMNGMHTQFFFPRMPLMIPPFSVPAKRYHLFASRSPERYNVEEIMRWYTQKQLDADDVLMTKAEARGVKTRAYLDWLAKEPERLAYSREQMSIEDSVGKQRRQIDKIIAERMSFFEKKLIATDEFLDENPLGFKSINSIRSSVATNAGSDAGDEAQGGESPSPSPSRPYTAEDKSAPATMQFRFLSNLPKEYWYIFEESVEFRFSSGIYNEDEVEDMQELQKEAARKAIEDSLDFERELQEEKRKRDLEEKMRQKREEQDRRLKEGMARRRRIRENLEEIQRQRLIKQEEEMLAQMRAMEEARIKAEIEEKERKRIEEIERIERQRLEEIELMGLEELATREALVRKRELQQMELEDTFSFLREQLEVQEEIEREDHIRELAVIYEPFQPFEFKNSRIKRPALHEVLRDAKDIDENVFLRDVMMSLKNGDEDSIIGDKYLHNLALHQHETNSAYHNRSHRYDSLYGDSKPYDELDEIMQSRRTASMSHSSSPTASKKLVSSPTRREQLQYRERTHSPNKKQLRDLVSEIVQRERESLPFNPYGTDWELGYGKHVQPVLSSSSPYFSRPVTRAGLGSTQEQRSPTPLATEHYTTSQKSLGNAINRTVSSPPHLPLQPIASQKMDEDSQTTPHLKLVSEQESQRDFESRLNAISDCSDSFFRSLSPDASQVQKEETEQMNTTKEKSRTPGGGRKRMKELLSLSADVIAKSSQQEWLDFLATQKKLTMASLVSLDARHHAREMNPILASIKAQQRTAILPSPSSSSAPLQVGFPSSSTVSTGIPEIPLPAPDVPPKIHRRRKDVAMTQTLTVELSLLDSKTKKLGKSASETVLKLQQQRDAIRQYVSGNAILGDNYFLQACQPGVRTATSLEANEEVKKFAGKIQQEMMEGVNELNPEKELHTDLKKTPTKKINAKLSNIRSTVPLPAPEGGGLLPLAAQPGGEKSPSPRVSAPLPARVIVKTGGSSVNPLGAITGKTVKLEEDLKRKKRLMKPVKSASSSALPLSSVALLKDLPLSFALSSLPGSARSQTISGKKNGFKSIELNLKSPEMSHSDNFPKHSQLSLDSKPLPPIVITSDSIDPY